MADPYVRADVWSLSEDDPIITAYAGAVAAMQQKDPSDPTSWTFQAAMHGTELNVPATPPANQCQHFSWFFLPWHRMFIYYFEQIVRAQVIANGGPATWALPYWNYDGGGTTNTLPLAFRNPANADGSPNPLYVSQRGPGINDGAVLPASDVSAALAFELAAFTGPGEFGGGETLAPIQFFSQAGQLEGTPHGSVHNDVGGPDGLMADILAAAQDPIFWLHHANIDRLWWLWQQQNPGSDPADPGWASQNFLAAGGFFGADGQPIAASAILTCAMVENTTDLGYTYPPVTAPAPAAAPAAVPKMAEEVARVSWPAPWPERPQTPAGPGSPRHLVGATDSPVRLVGDAVTVPVAIDERATGSLQDARRVAPQQHRVFLDLEHVDAERNPGRTYGVYVNLPGQPTDADLAAHFAGNLSLFGIEAARSPRGDEHPHDLRISMDITRLLDRLAAAGQWTDGRQLEVTFRPTTLGPPPGREELAGELARTAHPDLPITIGRISIQYA
jgi:tyrosinase